MPEIRTDPFTGNDVIIAPERAVRPIKLAERDADDSPDDCPFCRGRESETPAELQTRTLPGESDPANWQVRVVPNKYPALVASAEDAASGMPTILKTRPGVGIHEVVVESPNHVRDFADLTDEEAICAVLAWRDRLLAARENDQIQWAMVFKNNGVAAGASLSHVHSQVIGLPLISQEVSQRITANNRRDGGQSVWRDLIDAELADGRRLVHHGDELIALCPFASRFPYEILIAPTKPASRFEEAAHAQLSRAALLLRDLLRRLRTAAGSPDYNVLVNTAPFDKNRPDHYQSWHWSIEILPRISKIAGFEWATGVMVNVVAPEDAAEQLRNA